MPQPKNLDPYTDPRAFYGAELRRLRERAGLSQEQLGEKVFCSGSYIGQFESASRRPQLDMSRILDDVLGSGEHLQRLCRLARTSKVADYFADAAELERLAQTISEYAPVLVPGLLQTEEYARAITRTANPFAPQEDVEELVRARMDRQRILEDPAVPVLWAILHEAVLLAPIGGPQAMGRQLLHIAELMERPRMVVQVLPFSAMSEAFMGSMVSVMTFTDSPTVVYTEGAGSGRLIENPALVEHNARAYDLARAAALSPSASRDLLASVAEDYANHEHHTRSE
ncbi:XRE family transcriptional regulator [Streptomyces sp. WAC05374]|uniref:helix-turn-helix domain-containing protein n=1 Tax=Streptomyces sp. WAC05374 TaxID=2487420 RepID=UPI000F8613DA|nr:helix-turn-helix transcriptional regulator [Streptomyces sp. WAC05374]RST15124.1 XRE family transcriptional regulator [Streptomyces sp. WAC05374]TDF41170.1 XRE family transcriptional regulator [Streptomyces sp. WAC05374]TDF49671.1 XRE family transcriptional regulator [Streptomyces sp. WAC05374]TDF51440.1 XRE family transcriptional regulator [Streptomyces sp. WAC05374]